MLNQDFREFVQSLNDSGALFLVVGGYAVALHGVPRYTKDLDLWIDNTPENAARVLDALDRFGFGELDISEDDLTRPDRVIQLGYPPVRIDLITSLEGVEFDECHAARLEVEVEGVIVSFIDLEHLKANKKATGRHQDLADLESLS